MDEIRARIAEVLRQHCQYFEYAYRHPTSPVCRCPGKCNETQSFSDHVADVLAEQLAPDIGKMAASLHAEHYQVSLFQAHLLWLATSEEHRQYWYGMARAAVAAVGWVRADDEGGAR